MPNDVPLGTLTVEGAQYKLEQMRAALPRPIPDTPYGLEVRDEIAGCIFIALHPADVLDADFACQIILLNAHANDCLRLARETPYDPKFARSVRAQARSMMRLMRGTLADLHARQLARAEAQAAQPQPAPAPAAFQPRPIPPPSQPTAPNANAREQRAARVRELDLRVIETPDTRH